MNNGLLKLISMFYAKQLNKIAKRKFLTHTPALSHNTLISRFYFEVFCYSNKNKFIDSISSVQ